MDYNHSFDSREHDSGYFTPSPDKDNKIIDSNANYNKKLEAINTGFNTTQNSTTTIPSLLLLSNSNNKLQSNSNTKLDKLNSKYDDDLISDKYNDINKKLNSSNPYVNISTSNSMNNLENPKSLLANQQQQQQQQQINDADRPPHSYIALISMAILSKADRKILLNEIYDWVIQNFPYYQFRTDKSWRNSIRHNLSLNECFVKVGKAGNGRGYYWSIHSANINDFKKGDFRRRQARLRAKHDKASAAVSTPSLSSASSSSSTSSNSSKSDKKQQNNENKSTSSSNNKHATNQSLSLTPLNDKLASNYMIYSNNQTPTSTPVMNTSSNSKIYNGNNNNSNSSYQSFNSSNGSLINSPTSLNYMNQTYQQPVTNQFNNQYSNYNMNSIYNTSNKSYSDNNYNHFNDTSLIDTNDKFLSPNMANSYADSTNLLLINKTNNSTTNQINGLTPSNGTTKMQSVSSSSLSTSPSSTSSSSSSTSSSSSSSSSTSSSTYFYNSYQPYNTNATNNQASSTPSSHQYNYMSSFSWIPTGASSSTNQTIQQISTTPTTTNLPASNFIDSFNSSSIPSYDLSFPYRV